MFFAWNTFYFDQPVLLHYLKAVLFYSPFWWSCVFTATFYLLCSIYLHWLNCSFTWFLSLFVVVVLLQCFFNFFGFFSAFSINVFRLLFDCHFTLNGTQCFTALCFFSCLLCDQICFSVFLAGFFFFFLTCYDQSGCSFLQCLFKNLASLWLYTQCSSCQS